MKITDIKINSRHRKDLGDLQTLADSITRLGLLHPVVVTSKHELIAGQRRLEAFKLLGKADIPVRVLDLERILDGELDENTIRKDFTPSEAVAIWKAMDTLQGKRTDLQLGRKLRRSEKPQERAAKVVGMSAKTLSQANAVVNSKDALLISAMDETGNVAGAVKALRSKAIQSERKELAKKSNTIKRSERWSVHCCDLAVWKTDHKFDWIITDPPYPKEFLPLYEVLSRRASEWLKDGGLLVALCGQSYLDQIFAMLSKHLEYYWTAAYLLPGQPTPLRQVNVNCSWKPLLIFGNGKYRGKIFGDVFRSDANDKDFHKWGQSVSGMTDIVSKLALAGERILDPFCGAGTTGIAAIKHGCLFEGVEIEAENAKIASARIGAA